MIFSKEDLVGHHYHWSNPVDPSVFSGEPSRRYFDRFNGDQVLFLINFYGALENTCTIREAHKIEDMIANSLPLEVKSEISVFNWLKDSMVNIVALP